MKACLQLEISVLLWRKPNLTRITNTEHRRKERVDYNTDRCVKLETTVSSFQITIDSKHTDAGKKCIESKQLQEKVKQKKLETKGFLIDIIRTFDNKNKNPHRYI